MVTVPILPVAPDFLLFSEDVRARFSGEASLLLSLKWFEIPYGIMFLMEKDFEPLKSRLREINERLDLEEQAYFGPLIENFTGNTSEFQRIMRDLGKFGSKIGTGSKFEVYREVQHLFHKALPKK